MQHPFAPIPGLGAPMRRFGTATRTAQSIGIEWFDYAKQSCDALAATAGRLATAGSPADAFAIQGAFLSEAAERFSARSAVFGDLFATLAGDLLRLMGAAVPVQAR